MESLQEMNESQFSQLHGHYMTEFSKNKAEEEGGQWTQGWYGIVLKNEILRPLIEATAWLLIDPLRALSVSRRSLLDFAYTVG